LYTNFYYICADAAATVALKRSLTEMPAVSRDDEEPHPAWQQDGKPSTGRADTSVRIVSPDTPARPPALKINDESVAPD